jgi:hypothetical protein
MGMRGHFLFSATDSAVKCNRQTYQLLKQDWTGTTNELLLKLGMNQSESLKNGVNCV